MISSELPEVLGMSDRVLVMRGGRIVGQFDRKDATPDAVGAAMTALGRRQPGISPVGLTGAARIMTVATQIMGPVPPSALEIGVRVPTARNWSSCGVIVILFVGVGALQPALPQHNNLTSIFVGNAYTPSPRSACRW